MHILPNNIKSTHFKTITLLYKVMPGLHKEDNSQNIVCNIFVFPVKVLNLVQYHDQCKLTIPIVTITVLYKLKSKHNHLMCDI